MYKVVIRPSRQGVKGGEGGILYISIQQVHHLSLPGGDISHTGGE